MFLSLFPSCDSNDGEIYLVHIMPLRRVINISREKFYSEPEIKSEPLLTDCKKVTKNPLIILKEMTDDKINFEPKNKIN